ncbi:sulfurtransferase TusA family protein [Fusibacter sp. JL216-2]|uniref:sulfurtransferase TusA family protein n=1 Tax=Fusibacter sp. JL216-2 TaxID=3071453 RepID=UPI003D338830
MNEIILECFSEICPVPLVRTQNTLKEMEIGDVLIVQIDHSCAMINIPDWALTNGHKVETDEVSDGEWEITITKMK